MNLRRNYALPFLLSFLQLCIIECRAQSLATDFFIENRGQWPSDVRYLTQLNGMDAWVTDRGILYDFYRLLPSEKSIPRPTDGFPFFDSLSSPLLLDRMIPAQPNPRIGHVVAMEFVGGSGRASADDGTKQSTYYNYFIGNDSTKWASRVPLYGSVTLDEVYPGIDAVLRFDEGSLRYDLHVAVGADPSQIRIRFDGAESIDLNDAGELVMATSLGDVVHGSIYAYQEIEGERRSVECRFGKEENGDVAFDIGAYDRRYPLVIDPLVYSTYLGGTAPCNGGPLTVDADGNAYVVGVTSGATYPTTTGAYDVTYNPGSTASEAGDIVVSKLNPSGTALIYSTFIGGTRSDAGNDIAMDEEGNVYVIGTSISTANTNDFPTTPGAFDLTPDNMWDMVVCKLNPDGTVLLYSTYIANDGNEVGTAMAIDRADNVYITGYTTSTNYPLTPGTYRTVNTAPSSSAFVTKLNAAGTALLYSTYISGNNVAYMYEIAVDGKGYAYVTGQTSPSTFPVTLGAYDVTPNGGLEAFATKLDTNGSSLIYSTFLGGTAHDLGTGLAVDSAGNLYVVGGTYSTDFPTTTNAFDRTLAGIQDGFVLKLDSIGSTLHYSTLLGGSDLDASHKLVVDARGTAIVVGYTFSTDYPTRPEAIDTTFDNTGPTPATDLFLSKVDPSGRILQYSTYFGAEGTDYPLGIALGHLESVYIAGNTLSIRFPLTRDALDSISPTTGMKMYVVRLGFDCLARARAGSDTALCEGSFVQLRAEGVNGFAPYEYEWSPAVGLSDAKIANPIASPSASTQYIVTITDRVGCVARDTVNVRVFTPPAADAGRDTLICSGASVMIGGSTSGAQPPFNYSWEPQSWLSDPEVAQPIATPRTSITYIVTVTDAEGCQDKDTIDVTVLESLVVDVGSDAAICPGESRTIGGEATGGIGPYRYQWEAAAGLSRSDTSRPTAMPTETTVYRMMVTDAMGCTAYDSIKITVRPKPAPVIAVTGSASLCKGDSVTLDAGAGYMEYRWSTGERTRTIRVGEAGRYSVEVTDAFGCKGTSDTVDIKINPPPDVEINGPVLVCANGTGIYAVSAGTDITYDWTLTSANGSIAAGLGTNSITVQWGAPESASIRLIVRDNATGCADTMDYAVTVGSELKPVITGPTVICAGESIELDAGDGYTKYDWSNGETTRTITVDRTMTVTVTVEDAGGCGGTSDPFTVTLKPAIEVKLTPGGEIRLCEGGDQDLTAPSGYAGYAWSTGETGESITVDDEGEYWVEVTDTDGCVGRSDTVRVERIEDEVKIAPSGDLALCDGDSLTLRAPTGYESYEWSTGERSESIVVKSAGAYWVRVTATGGCAFDSDTARVRVVPKPSKPTITRSGDTLISSPADSYQWLRDGSEIAGATEQRYVVRGPGMYGVRVFNVDGCSIESDRVEGTTGRVVWLDTVEGNVGEVLWLTMHVSPPLTASEGVTSYRAWLRWNPDALYPEEATSASRAVAGVNTRLAYDGYGAVEVERLPGGSGMEGETLFQLGVRGLITGQPKNVVTIDSIEVSGLGSVAIAGEGLVILHGCELGRGFGKMAEIVSIVPNPAVDEIAVTYRTPAGMSARMRVVDLVGRVVLDRPLNEGSGEEEGVLLKLNGLEEGLYVLELRDGEEVVGVPLLIGR